MLHYRSHRITKLLLVFILSFATTVLSFFKCAYNLILGIEIICPVFTSRSHMPWHNRKINQKVTYRPNSRLETFQFVLDSQRHRLLFLLHQRNGRFTVHKIKRRLHTMPRILLSHNDDLHLPLKNFTLDIGLDITVGVRDIPVFPAYRGIWRRSGRRFSA